MEYLLVGRGANEPDNNTPSDEIWVKIISCEEANIFDYVRNLEESFEVDYPHGFYINALPLPDIEDAWEKVEEIW